MVNPTQEALHRLSVRIDAQAPRLAHLDSYFMGKAPTSFLSPTAAAQLGNRLRGLSVNFPRLAVMSLAERLTVAGFRTASDQPSDPDLWRSWLTNGMADASAQAHVEALTLGRAFALVWARRDGSPSVTVESARQVAVERDPVTREVTVAAKRWYEGVGQDRHMVGVVYEPDQITKFRSKQTVAVDITTPWDGTVIPMDGWVQDPSATQAVIRNPLGVVPVVPLVNHGRLLDVDGSSEMADLLDLADLLNKIMLDAATTSEFYARPRRWATGLEVAEDEDGNPINPFQDGPDRVWQSEDPQTRFGQFDTASLSGYTDMIATITTQLSALAALPPHYLGLHGDQATSADALRASEASLVAKALARQRTFGAAWSQVGRLMVAIREGLPPSSFDVETVWASAETRTPAQAADAAAKLVAAGILSVPAAQASLGYSPEEIDQMRADRRAASLDMQGVDLTKFGVP